jgi:acyl-coenzyme A synthetase/AMP-(fatty) acid ligase
MSVLAADGKRRPLAAEHTGQLGEAALEHGTDHTSPVEQPPLVWTTSPAVPITRDGPSNPYEPVPIADGAGDGIRWLERTVARFPDRIAVTDDRVALRYDELLDRVYGLAARIADAVPPSGAVVSLLHNGPAAAVATLAAMCCGRTIIPIDAGHPIERQTAILSVAGTPVVIVAAGQELDPALPLGAATLIPFDPDEPTGAPRPADIALDPAVPTAVLFTSGSTGKPKGVAHRLQPRSIAWFVEKFRLSERDVFICLASMSQTGVADLICLATGGTLHIIDVRRRGMGDALTVMRTAGVTFLSFVPSAIRMVLAVPGIEHALSSLRVLDLHGERILASDLALLRAKLAPGCHICVTYGATEVGTVFSWFVRDEAVDGETVPVGYLCPNIAFTLVGDDGATVAEGKTGELLVRGRIALGDWAGGRLIADRFVPSPDEPGTRVYAMGDLVTIRPDGLAMFMGRRDRKVKIRGLWCDLGEVEDALRTSGDVVDAVALVRETDGQADEIAAFVVPTDLASLPAAGDLRAIVAAATAEHMAPRRVQFLATIPRLPNYKPDIARMRSGG